jgi:Na+-transporting methylmalonyl-CoA/oxaloacetate decarboxylase gamma subunit
MRSFIELMGLIAANISALIVLAFVCLVILAIILMGVGAYESATNPHIEQDTAQEYAQVQQNISHAQAGIAGAVGNVTGG